MRTLLITSRPPFPTSNGGYQRTNLLFRSLADLGSVSMLLLADEIAVVPEEIDRLKEEFGLKAIMLPGVRADEALAVPVIVPDAPRLASRAWSRVNPWHGFFAVDSNLSRWLSRFLETEPVDLIVSRYLRPAAVTGALGRDAVIVDVDDLDSQRRLSSLRVAGERGRLVRLRKAEARALRRAAHLWVTNDRDLNLVGGSRISVLPNIPFAPPSSPLAPVPVSSEVLFVGSFRYDVNVRAVDRFVRAVWPKVRRSHPDATLRLVGWGMSDTQRAVWSRIEGVVPTGYEDSLEEAYRACALAVVPIFEGGGSKIKVLEALSYGRTCVMTDYAATGYENSLRHLESVWIATDEAGLAEGCVKLLGDWQLRARLAGRGAAAVRRTYTFEAFRLEVARTVERVLDRRR